MSQPTPGNDRRQELQVDRALFGLSADEQRELAALAGGAGRTSDVAMPDEFELTAAALDVALHEAAHVALPTHVRQRILLASRADASRTTPASSLSPAASAPSRRELAAWFVAAASLLVAAFLGLRSPSSAATPTAAALREHLLAERTARPDAVTQVAWTRGEDPTAAQAEGDVLWSDADQAGVMRFKGLAPNDPTKEQYQLWIFDTARDDAQPVDGGVFNVPAGGGDVLTPIDAKLPITKAKMFAITVERPGGVVVSDRSRLPLLAQVE